MFKIEKNIPLKASHAYPFDQMQSGDSFLVPETDKAKISGIRAQINSLKKKYPNKIISTRTEDYGLRVWVISKE